jgi:hypothetical protein
MIESQELTESHIASLRNLSTEVEHVVRSEDFERLVKEHRWTTSYGHCSVAACAMQVLSWVVYGVYLDTYSASFQTNVSFSHWFVCDPTEAMKLDPTKYQFEDRENGSHELDTFYGVAVRRGHPSRRQDAPYYTNSPPVRHIIDVVSSRLGLTDKGSG